MNPRKRKKWPQLLLAIFALSTPAQAAEIKSEAYSTVRYADQLREGKNYAIVIGIADYQHDNIDDLKTAARDAQTVGDLLEEEYGFQVTRLIDSQATRPAIFKELYLLRGKVQEPDSVVIYYAGHGERSDLGAFWQPWGAKPASEAGAEASWIASHSILNQLKALKNRHVLVMSDSCWSEGLIGDSYRGEVRRTDADKDETHASILKRRDKKSRYIFTSGGDEPVADWTPHISTSHSVFAYFLLKNLKDMQADPFTVASLVEKVGPLVGNNAKQQPTGAPMRNAGDKGGQLVFVSNSVRRPASPNAPEPGEDIDIKIKWHEAELRKLKLKRKRTTTKNYSSAVGLEGAVHSKVRVAAAAHEARRTAEVEASVDDRAKAACAPYKDPFRGGGYIYRQCLLWRDGRLTKKQFREVQLRSLGLPTEADTRRQHHKQATYEPFSFSRWIKNLFSFSKKREETTKPSLDTIFNQKTPKARAAAFNDAIAAWKERQANPLVLHKDDPERAKLEALIAPLSQRVEAFKQYAWGTTHRANWDMLNAKRKELQFIEQEIGNRLSHVKDPNVAQKLFIHCAVATLIGESHLAFADMIYNVPHTSEVDEEEFEIIQEALSDLYVATEDRGKTRLEAVLQKREEHHVNSQWTQRALKTLSSRYPSEYNDVLGKHSMPTPSQIHPSVAMTSLTSASTPLNKSHVPPIMALAKAAIDQHWFTVARALMERAYDLSPDDPQVLNLLAITHMETGSKDVAQNILAHAIADNPELVFLKMSSLRSLEDISKAQEQRKELLDLIGEPIDGGWRCLTDICEAQAKQFKRIEAKIAREKERKKRAERNALQRQKEALEGTSGGIKQVVRAKKSQIQYCYEQSLKANSGLAGRLELELEISNGKVTAARAIKNETGDPTLASCAEGKVRTWRFDTAVNATIRLPFALSTD